MTTQVLITRQYSLRHHRRAPHGGASDILLHTYGLSECTDCVDANVSNSTLTGIASSCRCHAAVIEQLIDGIGIPASLFVVLLFLSRLVVASPIHRRQTIRITSARSLPVAFTETGAAERIRVVRMRPSLRTPNDLMDSYSIPHPPCSELLSPKRVSKTTDVGRKKKKDWPLAKATMGLLKRGRNFDRRPRAWKLLPHNRQRLRSETDREGKWTSRKSPEAWKARTYTVHTHTCNLVP